MLILFPCNVKKEGQIPLADSLFTVTVFLPSELMSTVGSIPEVSATNLPTLLSPALLTAEKLFPLSVAISASVFLLIEVQADFKSDSAASTAFWLYRISRFSLAVTKASAFSYPVISNFIASCNSIAVEVQLSGIEA